MHAQRRQGVLARPQVRPENNNVGCHTSQAIDVAKQSDSLSAKVVYFPYCHILCPILFLNISVSNKYTSTRERVILPDLVEQGRMDD